MDKLYESEDEGHHRTKAQRFPGDKRLTSSYPATPRTLERTNKNFISMKLVEAGGVQNFDSILLQSGQNWRGKFRKAPPSRDVNNDFRDLMTDENISFMDRQRDAPYSPAIPRPGTEELMNRDGKLKELKIKLEEGHAKLQKEKDEF